MLSCCNTSVNHLIHSIIVEEFLARPNRSTRSRRIDINYFEIDVNNGDEEGSDEADMNEESDDERYEIVSTAGVLLPMMCRLIVLTCHNVLVFMDLRSAIS